MAKRKRIKSNPIRIIFKVIYKTILYTFLLIIALGSGVAVGGGLFGLNLFLQYQKTTPELDLSKLDNIQPSQIIDTEGNLIAEIGAEERKEVKIDDVPQDFLDALISTEDSRFYSHHGFDFIRTGKAVLENIRGGFGSQGGSTLTQQLAKLTFLDQNEDSLKRKTHELTLAWEMEDMFTKDEILELYVNKIYMGDGVYGIQTAANHFYDKDLKELTIPQLALLAGIPNAPSAYNPYDNPDLAKQRRNIVLYRMLATGTINKKQYNEYVDVPIDDGLRSAEEARKSTLNNVPKEYQYYVDEAIKEVKTKLNKDPYTDGLKITVALNKGLQEFANKFTSTNDYINYPNSEMMINFTIIDNNTGRVLANGSGNRETKIVPDGFNFATQSQKQAGSTMKPILSYAPAVEYLGLTRKSIVDDSPYKYSDGTPLYNWDRSYDGEIPLSRALASSRNVPAAKLLKQVGLNKAYTFANKLGMGFAEEDYVESGPLGSVSNSNPLKMASAYSAFARNGNYVEGHTVIKVTDLYDKVLYTEPQGTQVMKDSTAYEITRMLLETGTETYGSLYGRMDESIGQIALKSGTTNYSASEANYGKNLVPDSWAIGYTKDYTVAVWQGYDSRNQGLGYGTESKLAGDALNTIFKQLGVKNSKFTAPATALK